MRWRAHSHCSRKIRRSAISCPSGLSWSCRMKSARTSLGEVRTRRRSRRAAGPSASARRAASSQNTRARAYQRSGLQGSCRYIRPVVKPPWQSPGCQDGIRSPPITIATWTAASRFVVATNQWDQPPTKRDDTPPPGLPAGRRPSIHEASARLTQPDTQRRRGPPKSPSGLGRYASTRCRVRRYPVSGPASRRKKGSSRPRRRARDQSGR
jgi:hypothetical protein